MRRAKSGGENARQHRPAEDAGDKIRLAQAKALAQEQGGARSGRRHLEAQPCFKAREQMPGGRRRVRAVPFAVDSEGA